MLRIQQVLVYNETVLTEKTIKDNRNDPGIEARLTSLRDRQKNILDNAAAIMEEL